MGTGPVGSVFVENLFYRETRDTRLGDRHVAKRSSDPRVAYPEKVQVRDLVHVMGILASFVPRGSIFGENSFYRAPEGKWDGYPQQQYATGEPGKVQGQDHVGIVEGSCGYRASGFSVRGKFVSSRNPGYKIKGSSCG